MVIILPPELEHFIEERVRAGEYADASDVVASALSALKVQEEAATAELRREIAIGITQAEQGDFVEFTADDVIADGRSRLAKRDQ